MIDEEIAALKDLIRTNSERRELNRKIRDLKALIDDLMAQFGNTFENLGADVEKIINVCNEMKNGAGPDESADYWEEKCKID